jgi:hypothetical protein
MRTTGILLTLLFAFTALSALAVDQAKAAPSQNDSAIAAVPDSENSLGIIPADPDGLTLGSSPNVYRRYLNRDSQTETYCFKMRSDLMERESRNSDSTRLVGYTTCHPASRIQLKTTLEIADPAPAK